MANKLAGQRAKFSRARAVYYTSSDERQRQRAVELMTEVLVQAPQNSFTEEMVTQGEDVPDEVRHFMAHPNHSSEPCEESDDDLVGRLRETVDTTDVFETGEGNESVYAYGYRCAPDRLKIGSCATGDAIARVAAQISTSTPDKPTLALVINTHDCRALERALHGAFRVRGRQVSGAGAEWFITGREEIVSLYKSIVG